uniref:Beta-1,4-N-acetylgalactosaminyltransferase bre-4 n=2 Tax=Parascaris univalens TaxID=6257 RepID=A0A915C8Z4_PARUN
MNHRIICVLLVYMLFGRVIGSTKCSQISVIDDPYKRLLTDNKSTESMCGTYRPLDCEYDEKIAILVPYRNREIQLRILINYLVQFLISYRKYFAIFVIEPFDGQIFNRGKLFNAGFDVANTIDEWDCFFFHDVDLIPTNRSIPYKCPNKGTAQHWSTSVDKFDFKLPYDDYFGGVSAMNADEFIAVNGYPNAFWGWGGEDDCFEYRVKNSKITIVRASNGATKYTMLRHGQNEKGNEVNPCRFEILKRWKELWQIDGLNTLNYAVVSFEMYSFYYHLVIDLKPPSDICATAKC